MKGSDHLLIQGTFGELPDIGTSWDEAGLQQWLDLVETAARVIYRLPSKAENQHRHGRGAAGPAKEET
jgi:hypothetical protein